MISIWGGYLSRWNFWETWLIHHLVMFWAFLKHWSHWLSHHLTHNLIANQSVVAHVLHNQTAARSVRPGFFHIEKSLFHHLVYQTCRWRSILNISSVTEIEVRKRGHLTSGDFITSLWIHYLLLFFFYERMYLFKVFMVNGQNDGYRNDILKDVSKKLKGISLIQMWTNVICLII